MDMTLVLTAIEWVATITSLIGCMAIARKKIIGLYLYIISNFFWTYVAYRHGIYGY